MKFKFIDLFAGIGGFHIAMESLGGECVFASEIDKYALETYYKNFNIDANNDITKIDPKYIGDYNVLCGGFPCQTFSKAGKQKGFDEVRGTLFYDIVRLLKFRIDNNSPVEYLILENVRNLISHDKGNTISIIKNILENELNYNLKIIIISPHQIGIPQLRERVFILGIHKSFNKNIDIVSPKLKLNNRNISDIYSFLDSKKVEEEYYLKKEEEEILKIWDEFIKGIKEKIIGFPIWLDYLNNEEIPIYFPIWKYNIIKRNKELYFNNKNFIDKWTKKYSNLEKFIPTQRKFEWQAGNNIDTLWEGIIQFRPSGIRIKKPTEFPALVAMVHIPIIGRYKRRLTIEEVSRLQSFPNNFKSHKIKQQAYKQYGNSVNVEVVKYISKQLLEC